MGNEKVFRGNASQFFVAGELCRRGFSAVVPLGNTPNVDVLCSNLSGTRFAHVQVKTFVPGDRTCSVGVKAELDFGPSFFWVLAGVPEPNSGHVFEYYVIPSFEMARRVKAEHAAWLGEPGLGGRPHRDSLVRIVHLTPRVSPGGWDLTQYRGQWGAIEAHLLG